MRAKNVGNIDRAARVFGGALMAALGLTLLVAAGGPAWLIAIDAMLIALGLDFFVTSDSALMVSSARYDPRS